MSTFFSKFFYYRLTTLEAPKIDLNIKVLKFKQTSIINYKYFEHFFREKFKLHP